MDKYTIGDIVSVRWEDSVHQSGWGQLQPETTMVILSVGYLVGKTADRCIITTSLGPRGDYLSPLHIPISAIQEVKVLSHD